MTVRWTTLRPTGGAEHTLAAGLGVLGLLAWAMSGRLSGRPALGHPPGPLSGLDTVSTAAGSCTFDVSPAQLHLVVMSAGRVFRIRPTAPARARPRPAG